jgi:hypothetical protein
MSLEKTLLERSIAVLDKISIKEGITFEPYEIVNGINLDLVRDGDSSECWKAAEYIKKINGTMPR